MKKQSLSVSMPKLILAVVSIVCIGAVFGLTGYNLIKKPMEIETSEVKTTDETIKNDISDWQTYKNEEIKYEMKYPKDWTVKENSSLHPFGEYIKNIQFFSPNEKYVLLFGIKQKDADFRLDGRTGVMAGNFVKDDRFIKIGGVDIEIENLVYEKKIKEVWYKYFQINDFVGKATFSFGNDVDLDGKLNLKNTRELRIAEKILESFKLIETEKADTSDWQIYRNEEFGFEITLTDIWDGYKTITKSDGARAHVEFQIPTKDTNYGDRNGYAAPFIISVYPILEWQKIQQDEGPKPKYIAQNDINVFAYSTWQDPSLDLLGKNIGFDQIISTFKFTQK